MLKNRNIISAKSKTKRVVSGIYLNFYAEMICGKKTALNVCAKNW